MATALDRPNRFPWPPVITLGLLVASILLYQVYPLGWRAETPAGQMLRFAGGVLLVTALLLYAASFHAFRRARTNILPHRPANHLVTSGPYAFSRNPIYLSNALLTFGIGLAVGNAWFMIAAIAGIYLEQKLAVEREERHLEHKFGKAWRDYAKRVRRWI